MARLAGIELNDNWRVEYALTQLKGIGWAKSGSILKDLDFKNSLRVKDLNTKDLTTIAKKVDEHLIEGELIRKVKADIQRLKVTGSYRGVRHERGLPSRGQRTKSNARTKRGGRKTVGSFKKEMLAKMQQN